VADQSAAGRLISLGPSPAEANRIMGASTARILAGAKAADLPVQQLTHIELVINLRTAKALGLTVSATLLGCAEEAFE
jgi:putative ABC transport system substrate-binding protein